MVKLDINKIQELQSQPTQIRNLSIIAHVDHGKTTLADSLLLHAGLVAQIGRSGMSTTETERTRGITIKSSGISLYFSLPDSISHPPKESKSREFLLNIIDSPGHVDFSSEVTAALRITDGGLVVVDCVEGCAPQTETVLRQSLQERVKPVLVVNKIDRAIVELQLDAEHCYQQFLKSIDYVNQVITTYCDPQFQWLMDATKGNICFASGKQGWAFTLNHFARLYSKRFEMEPEELVHKLWGDNYYDPTSKTFITSPQNSKGEKLERSFCKFVMEPIMKVFKVCLDGTAQDVDTLINKITSIQQLPNPIVNAKERQSVEKPKDLVALILSRWLPATPALLEMMCFHLPSPFESAKYRTEVLYSGPQDDQTATSMRACDPKGPLLVYISKLLPVHNSPSKFFGFGRVFSGTLRTGSKVRVLGPAYSAFSNEDLFTDVSIQRVSTVMCSNTETVEEMPVGNTVAILGIDKYISKSATVVELKESMPLQNLKHANSPVVRVAVSTKKTSDLPKLVESLKRLLKSDPLVLCFIAEPGEHIVACGGELHLEVCLNILKEFLGDVELQTSQPLVTFKETVTAKGQICLAKSPNGHNRIYTTAQPLGEELVSSLWPSVDNNNNNNNKAVSIANMDAKLRVRTLVDKFGWEESVARKIWSFAPAEHQHSSVLCESTKGIQNLSEIKEHVVAGFQWVLSNGVLCAESLYGVRFELTDAVLHSDSIHRGPRQIIPPTKRVLQASQLCARPRLMEPIFLTEITTQQKALNGIFEVLNKRRVKVLETVPRGVGSNFVVKAYLPVLESFGLTDALRSETSGFAFPQCTFSHFELVNGDPLDSSKPSLAYDLVRQVRKRKGMEIEIPAFDKLNEKL